MKLSDLTRTQAEELYTDLAQYGRTPRVCQNHGVECASTVEAQQMFDTLGRMFKADTSAQDRREAGRKARKATSKPTLDYVPAVGDRVLDAYTVTAVVVDRKGRTAVAVKSDRGVSMILEVE